METSTSSTAAPPPAQPNSNAIKEKQSEPDSDTIKMFVGQIPRTYTEADCMKIFEEYGPIYQLNIHRDKATGESKGCCFVTYYHRQDAMKAQDALHNTKILPGMHNAMQVKPADLENRNERKLFIGMLSRTAVEEDVRKLFEPYGAIEEVTVLRDAGKSRGCAFVTFVNRSCANTAIRQMHHSMTFEGCSKPIVVKLADSNNNDSRKTGNDGASPMPQLLQQLVQNSLPASGNVTNQLSSLGALLQNQSVVTLLGTVIAGLVNTANNNQEQQNKPNVASGSSSSNHAPSSSAMSGGASSSNGEGSAPLLAHQQQLQALQQQQQYLELLKHQQAQQFTIDPTTGQIMLAPQLPSLTNFIPPHYASLVDYQQKTSTSPFLDPTNLIPRTLPAAVPPPPPIVDPTSMLLSGATTSVAPPSYGNGVPVLYNNNSITSTTASTGVNTSKGPEGCNLFIYHLPQEFGDDELKNLFSHFGAVISAKVFIDKQTNLSKCFGFVSFDSAANAQAAIRGMNGFSIGSKRLKVQLKRSGDKPYARGDAASPANSDLHY